MLKESVTDVLKTALKRAIQKTAEATGNLIGNKLLIKLQKTQDLHHRVFQRQLQMEKKIWDLIEKYQKKDISKKRQKVIDMLRLI